jgi:hypothetical protein
VELVKAHAHNDLWLEAVRAVDVGSYVTIQVKFSRTVVSGSFVSYVLSQGQGTITPYQPYVNNNSYTVLANANVGKIDGEEVQKAFANPVRFSGKTSFDDNVGIGTTSPNADFVVSHQGTSGIEIEANFQMGVNNILSFDRTVGALAYETMRLSANDYWFTTLGIERMRITSSGNVGIGTTSPSAQLTVAKSATIGAASTHNTTTNIENVLKVKGKNNYSDGTTWFGDYGQILLSASNNMTASARQFLITNALDNNKFAIIRSTDWSTPPSTNSTATGVNSGTADFVITNVGNVGVGTTSPDTLLQATNTADGTDYISYEIGNTAVNAGNKGGFAIYEVGTKQVTLEYYRDGSAITNLSTPYIFTLDTNSQERMRINSSGNVGIGTTSPSGKIHLLGSYNSQFFTQSTGGTTNKFGITSGTAYAAFTVGSSLTQAARFYHDNSYITFAENGANVGIGTTSPSYKLDVSGSGRFSGPINAQGGLYFRGDANMGFIPYPIGGQLRSDLSPATGYVMIKLPTDIGNQPDDMISFHVDIYDYTTNEMISVYIGGYVYTNGSGGNAYWYNCTSIITTKEDDKDFNVRFGWDGTNYYVAIGETTSTWQHPSIIVRDFQCSFRGSIEQYIDGWNVSIGTSALVGVDETQSGNLPKASSASLSTASSLYDLIPNGAFTTTYAFTSTAGTWSEVMEGNDVITSSGTYSIQVFVDDNGVGGTQYDEYYSGTMSWFATGTNDAGGGAISEIVLHRAGHAANTGVIYLRTRETTNAETNKLKLEVMSNKTYTGASNLVFKFVRLI